MNVIVSNKQKDIIDNANIDAIKDLNGLFNVDDLISKFKNYFFSKMILDATSVVNFTMPEVLEKLVQGIGSDKLIILLPQQPEPPREFIDKLISLNIHHFSTNIEDILGFINEEEKNTTNNNIAFTDTNTYSNSNELNTINNNIASANSYDAENNANSIANNSNLYNNDTMDTINNNEIANSHFDNSNNFNSDVSYSDVLANMNVASSNIQSTNMQQNNNVLDANNNNSYGTSNIPYNVASGVQVEPVQNSISSQDYLVGPSVTNMMQGVEVQKQNNYSMQNTMPYVANNGVNDIVQNQQNSVQGNVFIQKDFYNATSLNENKKFILGIINVTEHAGSTTLTYLIKKALERDFHKTVSAIEVNKNDFIVYRDKKMISANDNNVKEYIDKINDDFIIIDLNNKNNLDLCNDVLYLVEPSLIKVNKLMLTKSDIFQSLVTQKVILNKSFLTESDVKIFEKEAGIKIFANIPTLNDRVNNQIVSRLLISLNIM